MKLIPIVIFAYNRPSHFKRVTIALQNIRVQNKIYLIIDGPKNQKEKILQEDILGSVEVIGNFNKFKKNQITIIKNKKNLGLAGSILNGLDKVSKLHSSFIVLEDDTIPYSNSIKFFTMCLKKYIKEKKVAAICGYQFMNFNKNKKIIQTKFLKHFIPWGWAIWSKNWKIYRANWKKIKNEKSFKVPNFIKNIRKKISKNNNKKKYWSIDFMKYNYITDKYFVYPAVPLIKNIGFDGSGTNCVITNQLNVRETKNKKIYLKNFYLNKKNIINHENLLKKVINNFYN